MGLGQDLVGRAGLDELLQHLAAQVAGILDLAVELAVREGARPALAELDVGLRVQLAAPPQAPGVLGPLAHHLAPVQDDRLEAHLGQDQPGEQPAGPGADHHGARAFEVLRRLGDQAVVGVRRRPYLAVALEPRQHGGLVPQRDVDRIDHQDRGLLPRVMGAADDGVAEEVALGDAQAVADRRGQGFGGMAEGELQVGDAEHGAGFSRKCALTLSAR
jgi:hypothetical protein